VKAEHPVKTDRMITGRQIDKMRLMDRGKSAFGKVKTP
jgi:hypothetical protein